LFAAKDAVEQGHIKRAALLANTAMKHFVIPEIESIIDEGKAVSHKHISDKAAGVIAEPSKLKVKLETEHVDICYEPIIQSGGIYDLRPSAQSTNKHLHFGTIVMSLGASYRSYCSNIARTVLIDPSSEQEAVYNVLLEAHTAAIAALRPGAPVSAAMDAAVAVITQKKPELVSKLVKSLGFAMGMEFRDSAWLITSKNSRVVHPGMVFNVATGLQDLDREDAPDPESFKYAQLFVLI